MEAWHLIVEHPAMHRVLDMQSEDACVLAAKALSERLQADAICVNTFDGRVLWFERGKQVEK